MMPAFCAASAEDGGELAALEREYEELQVAEAEAAAGLRVRAAKERQKALAVQAQQQLWQRGLEMRILLQKVLQGSNRLPLVSRGACTTRLLALLASHSGLTHGGADSSVHPERLQC